VTKKTKLIAKKFSFFLFLIIFSLVGINLPVHLFANSEPIPISGTPKLRPKNDQLFKKNGLGTIRQLEKDTNRIFADILNQQQTFWAFDFNYPTDDLNGYYQITATCRNSTLLRTGYYLYIYVENGINLSKSIIDDIQYEFINNILPKITSHFGSPPPKDFTILILDIKDDYNPAYGNNTYVSGYFHSINENSVAYSNNRSMIYLDANPGVPGTITFFGTLAHEFQHFIHYKIDPYEETWINEGLSGLARYICGYGHRKSHIEAFGRNPNTSLTVWNDSLANYGATYLFMLFLATHYGGPTTTRNIVANTDRGINGINKALWQSGYAVNFNDVFRIWVIANYLNNSSIYNGIYGYDDPFDDISPAPGNMQISKTHTSYPAAGRGSINPYAAEYINFGFLGGIYDIFVLVAHSTSGGTYAYSGNLGSLSLHIDGVNDQMRMSGIQQSTSHFSPIVLPDLYTDNKISTFGGLSWESSGGGCFIATAIYGSPIAKEITILREFRDRFLLNNHWGKKIVDLYYRYSPTLARFISQSEKLRSTARLLMYPLIGVSYGLIRYPLSTLISMIIFGAFLLRKICSQKKKKVIILPDD